MTEWKLVPRRIINSILDLPQEIAPDPADERDIRLAWIREHVRKKVALLAAAPEPPSDPRDAEIERLREALAALLKAGEHADCVPFSGNCPRCVAEIDGRIALRKENDDE